MSFTLIKEEYVLYVLLSWGICPICPIVMRNMSFMSYCHEEYVLYVLLSWGICHICHIVMRNMSYMSYCHDEYVKIWYWPYMPVIISLLLLLFHILFTLLTHRCLNNYCSSILLVYQYIIILFLTNS